MNVANSKKGKGDENDVFFISVHSSHCLCLSVGGHTLMHIQVDKFGEKEQMANAMPVAYLYVQCWHRTYRDIHRPALSAGPG